MMPRAARPRIADLTRAIKAFARAGERAEIRIMLPFDAKCGFPAPPAPVSTLPTEHPATERTHG